MKYGVIRNILMSAADPTYIYELPGIVYYVVFDIELRLSQGMVVNLHC